VVRLETKVSSLGVQIFNSYIVATLIMSTLELRMARLQDSSEYLGDTARLNEILSERGYLFLRDALGRKKIERVGGDIISVLKSFGFVPPGESEAVWSGKVPSGNELTLGHGGAVTRINNLPSIKNLILRGGQVILLKRLLGGEIFSWVENKDRGIRIMLPGKMSYSSVGGVKGTTVTPAHQDNYFFRTPNYYTTWIPLMDTDESVGGLAIAEGSHRNGYYQHWYRGPEYLGVPENRQEAESWSVSGGSPATGDMRAEDFAMTWLNADYLAGDLLIFHPLMLHRGLENTSNKIRLSADIRYQRRGTPTIWRARHTFSYSKRFEAELRDTVAKMGVEPTLALKVIDRLYVEGPRPEGLKTRARAVAKSLTVTSK
jgi:hypothetical protein